MDTSRYRALVLCVAVGIGCSDASEPRDTAPDRQTQASHTAAGPTVALLEGDPLGTTTDLVLQPAGASAPAAPVATLEHVRGGEVRGAVLPGTHAVVAVADMELRHEPSWGAWLVRLEPGHAPQKLVDRVYHATRPLVTDDGRVFVERGRAGPELPGQLRIDALTIDEVDPETGAARTVYAWNGYITFLAGAIDHELVVYRVTAGHADLVAVDMGSGAERVIAPEIPAFAHDFSIERETRALVYENRDPASGAWRAVRRDLASGAPTFGAPGAGVDHVRGHTPDAKWTTFVHELPDRLPAPFVREAATGLEEPLALPPGKRADVAGFVR